MIAKTKIMLQTKRLQISQAPASSAKYMKRVVFLIAAYSLLLASCFGVLAHQQKQAITKVFFNPRTANIEVMHRFELHDAEHAVKEIFGSSADIMAKTETQEQFNQYVADRFNIFDSSKQNLDLVSVGYEIDGKHFWVYQETPAPKSMEGIYIAHNALRDIWLTQTNTINIEGNGELKTLTFTQNVELLEVTF